MTGLMITLPVLIVIGLVVWALALSAWDEWEVERDGSA